MATITLDLSQFKASGIYTVEYDASTSITLDTQTVRLVVGFSKSGPFNAPVYCPDVKTARSIFGEIDRDLEKKGSFFHRSLFTCLEVGPCFALALMPLNDDINSSNPDTTVYKSFSVSTSESNGVTSPALVSSFYNKERFFKPDESYFGATVNYSTSPNIGKIFNVVNLGLSPFSVIVRKSGDVNGFNITARDWFGSGKVPAFIANEFDFVSEYFVTVDIVSGNWTNYSVLANDPTFSSFFDEKGLIKSKITEFLNSSFVTRLGTFSGSLIPDLTDSNDVNYSIDTIINNAVGKTGLFTFLDREALADYDPSVGKVSGNVDLVGHSLLNSNTDNVNFLSYSFPVSSSFDYAEVASTDIATPIFEDGSANKLTDFKVGRVPGSVGQTPEKGYDSNTNTYVTYVANTHGYNLNDPNRVAYLESYYGQGNSGKFNNILVLRAAALSTAQYRYFTSLIPGSSLIAEQVGLTDRNGIVSSLNVVNVANDTFIKIGISHPSKSSEGTDITRQSKVYNLETNGLVRLYNGNAASQTTGGVGINQGDWVYAQKGNIVYYFRVLSAPSFDNTYNTANITLDITSPQAASNFSLVDDTFTFVWGSIYGLNGSNFDVLSASISDQGTIASYIKPNSFDYDSTDNTYVAGEYSKAYRDFQAGILTSGDIVYVGNIKTYLGVEYTRNISSAKVLKISAFLDEALSIPYYASSSYVWDFLSIRDDNGDSISGSPLRIYASAGGYALDIDASGLNATKTSFYLSTADANNLNVGDYVKADPMGTGDSSNYVLTRILTKRKVTTGSFSGSFIYTTNQRVVVTAGQVTRYKTIDSVATNYQFTYLPGFKLSSYHLPDGSQSQLAKILGVLDPANTNVSVALASRDTIAFRYIVDTFDGGLAPQSYPKNILSKLALKRQKCLALLNAPSIHKFIASVDPRFTDEPTPVNPKPLLNSSYIPQGGNLTLGPSFEYSLPDEANGAKFSGFFTPFFNIREFGRDVKIPPAADVSNNFVRKFTAGSPYAIVAGPRRGVISNPLLTSLEYDFSEEDRANIEPFGLNPIIFKRGTGNMIYSNQTSYQTLSSAFNNLHVRDLLITIETAVEEVLAGYMFEFNDASTRLQIKTIVDAYLDNIRTAGGIASYTTVMDSSNNTNAIVDQNTAIIDITIEPARGVNKFINRVTVSKSGGISSGGFAGV